MAYLDRILALLSKLRMGAFKNVITGLWSLVPILAMGCILPFLFTWIHFSNRTQDVHMLRVIDVPNASSSAATAAIETARGWQGLYLNTDLVLRHEEYKQLHYWEGSNWQDAPEVTELSALTLFVSSIPIHHYLHHVRISKRMSPFVQNKQTHSQFTSSFLYWKRSMQDGDSKYCFYFEANQTRAFCSTTVTGDYTSVLTLSTPNDNPSSSSVPSTYMPVTLKVETILDNQAWIRIHGTPIGSYSQVRWSKHGPSSTTYEYNNSSNNKSPLYRMLSETPATLLLLIIQGLLFLVYWNFNIPPSSVTMTFASVWNQGQVGRALIGSTAHLDVWHIGFNGMALYSIGIIWKVVHGHPSHFYTPTLH
jgi:hypothetical protein